MSKLEIPEQLEPMRAELEKSVLPVVRIKGTLQTGTSLWQSKFLGKPYMPKGFEYPKDKDGIPMNLLAQINFSEVPHIDPYPEKGILQFYIAGDHDVYGMDFDDYTRQDYFRVVYFEEVDMDEANLVNDFSFVPTDVNLPISKESALSFEFDEEPVSAHDYRFDKVFGSGTYSYFEKFGDKEDEISELFYKTFSGGGCKIGGYAFSTQEDPRGNDKYAEHSLVLLQIDTDNQLEIQWGDMGVGNFFIKPEDLKNKDFTNVVYNYDCY